MCVRYLLGILQYASSFSFKYSILIKTACTSSETNWAIKFFQISNHPLKNQTRYHLILDEVLPNIYESCQITYQYKANEEIANHPLTNTSRTKKKNPNSPNRLTPRLFQIKNKRTKFIKTNRILDNRRNIATKNGKIGMRNSKKQKQIIECNRKMEMKEKWDWMRRKYTWSSVEA